MDIEDVPDTPGLGSSSSRRRPGAVPVRRSTARTEADGILRPPEESTRVFMHTFGCGHNVSDGEYMAGQLAHRGFAVSDEFRGADCYVINSCTVKDPSEDHFVTMVKRARATGKPVVVAGCVPQGDPKNKQWSDVSVVGVRHIDQIQYVVDQALSGNTVRLLGPSTETVGSGKANSRHGAYASLKTALGDDDNEVDEEGDGPTARRSIPSLALPKVRRNRLIEILPVNVGCLNTCTYCKTKHARGDLQSWPIEDIVARVRKVVAEGVVEIRMTSEDTGAYGIDLGTDIVALLTAVTRELEGTSVMLRVGMSNPPYLLRHLEGVAELLRHPNVFEFLHLPVQSGSNAILDIMQREYTVEEFMRCVTTFRRVVPNIGLATDIICAFPGEGESEWQETMSLCRQVQFPYLNISRYYARRGTPAAAMPQVPHATSKARSAALTDLYNSYGGELNRALQGTIHDLWVTEVAHDKHHLIGHLKQGFVQVLIDPSTAAMGDRVRVRIVDVSSKYHVRGEVVKILGRTTLSASSPLPKAKADSTLQYHTSSLSLLLATGAAALFAIGRTVLTPA